MVFEFCFYLLFPSQNRTPSRKQFTLKFIPSYFEVYCYYLQNRMWRLWPLPVVPLEELAPNTWYIVDIRTPYSSYAIFIILSDHSKSRSFTKYWRLLLFMLYRRQSRRNPTSSNEPCFFFTSSSIKRRISLFQINDDNLFCLINDVFVQFCLIPFKWIVFIMTQAFEDPSRDHKYEKPHI